MYQMFSRLLDTKVEEIRRAVKDGKSVEEIMPKHDIDDDYMGIMDSPYNTIKLVNKASSFYRRTMSNPNVKQMSNPNDKHIP